MNPSFRLTKIFCAFVFLSLLAAACAAKIPLPPNSPYQTPLTVGKEKLLVQIAKTPAELTKGLSGRDKLTDQQGMLFDFRGSGKARPGFWMKEMKFSLDFIWINGGQIVGITANVPAPKNSQKILPIYYSPSAVDMVLEVNGGWTSSHQIQISSKVVFN